MTRLHIWIGGWIEIAQGLVRGLSGGAHAELAGSNVAPQPPAGVRADAGAIRT